MHGTARNGGSWLPGWSALAIRRIGVCSGRLCLRVWMGDLVGWSIRTAEGFVRLWAAGGFTYKLLAGSRVIGPAFGNLEHVLIASAYLHDIGYAEELATTGFRPLDGARYIRAEGHELVARLVAHHSGARVEARLRGFEDFEIEFPFQALGVGDALTFCDLTTSPAGERVSIDDRVDEIAERYGLGSPTGRAMLHSRDDFHRARSATLQHVRESGIRLQRIAGPSPSRWWEMRRRIESTISRSDMSDGSKNATS